MKIQFSSAFKSPKDDHKWFKNWVSQLELVNKRTYEKIEVETGLGKTMVYGLQTSDKNGAFGDFSRGKNHCIDLGF